MNLVYGEIVDLTTEDGMQIGRVRISGVIKKVPLELVEHPKRGDTILMCDGVAIAKVAPDQDRRDAANLSDFAIRASSFEPCVWPFQVS